MCTQKGWLLAGLILVAGVVAGCAHVPVQAPVRGDAAVPDIVPAAQAKRGSGPHLRFGGTGSICMCGHGPTEKQIEAAEARLRAAKGK